MSFFIAQNISVEFSSHHVNLDHLEAILWYRDTVLIGCKNRKQLFWFVAHDRHYLQAVIFLTAYLASAAASSWNKLHDGWQVRTNAIQVRSSS